MAEIAETFIAFSDKSASVTFTPATGNDSFAAGNADSRIFILAENTGAQAATVTLKAGDGPLSALGDVAAAVPAGAVVFLPLSRAESARVKLTSGQNHGSVVVATTVDSGGTVGNVGLAIVSVE